MSSISEATRVAVVVSGWPRLSETFALQELRALRQAGMLSAVFATKAGESRHRQPGSADVDPLVEVLPDADATVQGAVVAERLAGTSTTAVHGYFAHRPAEVAAVAAGRLGLPYGFSVHALDVRKVDDAELAGRARRAAVVVACNADAAASVRASGTAPTLVRHGVDLHRFAATPLPHGDSVRLLAVGRLVEKKGFDVLVDALGRLDDRFRLQLVGDGPERARIERAVIEGGLAGRVDLCGRRTHAELPDLYAAADIVVVPSIVDRRGDRDGLPNVVLEAMASGRPVVASEVGAISSAIRDGVTGRLVPPQDPGVLADALAELAADRSLAARLSAAARADVEARFDLHRCGQQLCRVLEEAYG